MKVLEVIERSSFNEVSEKVINGNYCRFYEFVKKVILWMNKEVGKKEKNIISMNAA